jgi:hypothetical protein
MLRWLMRRAVAAFELQWSYDASYLHELIGISPRAAWMFSRAAGIGKYRKDVPVAAWTAAAIAAVRREDCGPCTQLGVAMAEKAGVDARIITDGGGKAAAALNVIEGAGRVAAFLAGVARKGWTDDMTLRFERINDLPGVVLSGPRGPVQTTALEIEGEVVTAIYVVRNPDKLRHLPMA